MGRNNPENLYRKGTMIDLVPANRNYQTMSFPASRVQVQANWLGCCGDTNIIWTSPRKRDLVCLFIQKNKTGFPLRGNVQLLFPRLLSFASSAVSTRSLFPKYKTRDYL